MSHGLEVYDSSNNLLLTTESLGVLLADVWTAPASTNASKSYPEYAGMDIIAAAIPMRDTTSLGGHTISVSGTTVTATKTPAVPDHLTQVRPDSMVIVMVR